jgi:hypothetical protein
MHLLAIAVWTAGEVFAAGQLAGLVVHLARCTCAAATWARSDSPSEQQPSLRR